MKPSLAMIFTCLMAVSNAADWPWFHGPDRNGISPETNLNKDWGSRPPKLLWTAPMADRGNAGPCVASNTVFIIDHQPHPEGIRRLENNVVKAFDLQTGRLLWSNTFPDGGGPLYGQARTTPAYWKGKIYTQGRWGLVSCFDAATGQSNWAFDMVERYRGKIPEFRFSSSPFIENESLILCPGGSNNPVAVHLETGRTLWKGDIDDCSNYATTVVDTIDGRREFILYLAKGLYGADLEQGRQRWFFPWRTPFDTHASMPLVVGPNQVMIGASYKQGSILVHVSNGQASLGWSNGALLMHFTTPILYQGYVYAVVDPERPGYLVCVDPQSGEIRWKAEGFEKGGFIIADGTLIAIAGKTGDIVMAKADPNAYTELGRLKNPLSGAGQNWAPPVLSDGKLVVRCLWRVGVIDLR